MVSLPAFAKEPTPPPLDGMRQADRFDLNPTACARRRRIFICHCIDICYTGGMLHIYVLIYYNIYSLCTYYCVYSDKSHFVVSVCDALKIFHSPSRTVLIRPGSLCQATDNNSYLHKICHRNNIIIILLCRSMHVKQCSDAVRVHNILLR